MQQLNIVEITHKALSLCGYHYEAMQFSYKMLKKVLFLNPTNTLTAQPHSQELIQGS